MSERGPGARAVTAAALHAAKARIAAAPWSDERLPPWKRVKLFIETELQLTSGLGAGKSFKLRPWQLEIVKGIYRTKGRGQRLVRTAVLSVGRKNGKSTLIAALALAHLIGPLREARGQIVIAATDRDQAHVIFAEVEAMLKASDWLLDLVNIQMTARRIRSYLDDDSTLMALSSDARKAHGLNPTLVLLDELAQWGHGIGVRLYDALMTAGGARKAPLKIIISTQAPDDQSKMSELIDKGDADDPRFWRKVYVVPEEHDPFDEEYWHLANPALGDFRTLEDMRELADRARRMPSERAAFENLFLNRRVSADPRWLSRPDWMACQAEIDRDALRGQRCFGGLDLASVSDLTSFCLFFPASNSVLSWSWCPADRIAERSERDRVPYDIWAEEGWLEPTPGKATDKRVVARRLGELQALYRPEKIGFDRYGMSELSQFLEEIGIDLPLEEHGQGFVSMSTSMKAAETRVLNGQIRHDNPILTWCVSNVVVMQDDAGNVKPSKMRSREKIDPAVAMIMAIGLAAKALEQPRVYPVELERILEDAHAA